MMAEQTGPEDKEETKAALDEGSVQQLNEILATLRHGSLTLIIQNGKVVQIEKNEKIRLA
jgi:hypothetical protein